MAEAESVVVGVYPWMKVWAVARLLSGCVRLTPISTKGRDVTIGRKFGRSRREGNPGAHCSRSSIGTSLPLAREDRVLPV